MGDAFRIIQRGEADVMVGRLRSGGGAGAGCHDNAPGVKVRASWAGRGSHPRSRGSLAFFMVPLKHGILWYKPLQEPDAHTVMAP